MIKIGIIGKTNTGKTTFFNAATLLSAEIRPYPFTTKTPNIGTASASSPCVCRELGVNDDPRNSICINGWRFASTTIIDLPGLIKGAWMGKGLGNQFLSIAAQSDALVHLIDASGGIDADGNLVEAGFGDPVADYFDVEEELVMWYLKMIEGNRREIEKELKQKDLIKAMMPVLSGVKVTERHVESALVASGLVNKDYTEWDEEESKSFAYYLRDISKPTVVIANKMDLPNSEENFISISREIKDVIVAPASADAELALRRAEQKGLIEYRPGSEDFKVINPGELTEKQRWALKYMDKFVFSRIMRTGVQFALNTLIFKIMGYKMIFPVEDPNRYSDKSGRVLPDVFLMENDSTLMDLAREIHTELAKNLLHGIDVRTGLKLPTGYTLRDRDILTLVTAAKPKKARKV
ncbi:MAG: redox-regulated ATPase YchF [Nitrososphaeria archaeon]|nr:redox-regulated ATPase YchF [Nitrososphaeria archaeon]NIQ34201.1 redox-regulated ATPase YchF [Nitrososphaeria archaeon]